MSKVTDIHLRDGSIDTWEAAAYGNARIEDGMLWLTRPYTTFKEGWMAVYNMADVIKVITHEKTETEEDGEQD